MPVIAVVGAQWGDEGKGKVVDLLAEKARLVVRFSGGDNAGHTVINSYGEFKLHLVPSGIFYPHTTGIMGNGMVINPAVLIREMDELTERGIDIRNKLFISDRAHLIMPYHTLLDGLEEKFRGSTAIGTTGKGIGPAYTDKTARLGIRAGDLLDKGVFLEKLRAVLNIKNAILTKVYDVEPLSLDDVYRQYCQYGEKLAPHIKDTVTIVARALADNENVLLEGAQGTMLDPDFGTYPYVTSSSPMAGNSGTGAGISPSRINQTLGVFKAYCTRVGAGPFPTELDNKTGEFIRERAHEYGTTTSRARRCGWFDAVAAHYSTQLNGFTGALITRLDVLDIFPVIKIAVGYRLNGKTIDYFPAQADVLDKCQPVYEELPGWETPISDIRDYDRLPANAHHYLARLEKLTGCPIKLVSVGASREQSIFKEAIM
jgi:adenylosuccinate synthase